MSDGEIAAAGGDVDLFGEPLRPLRDRRGRPSFKKSKENQDFVAARAAAGWSQARIAEQLGCDEKTLRKNFSRELSDGRLIVEGIALDVLMRKMREGHVPSIRLMLDRLDVEDEAPRRTPPRDQEKPETRLGKKEERDRDAQLVPENWESTFDRRGRQ